MDKKKATQKFDLEERTTEFAKRVIKLCRALPRDPINDIKQNTNTPLNPLSRGDFDTV